MKKALGYTMVGIAASFLIGGLAYRFGFEVIKIAFLAVALTFLVVRGIMLINED